MASFYLNNKCNLCPNSCNAFRTDGKLGKCGLKDCVFVAHYRLHNWEEPVISGTRGSGTIFFSGCTMKCVFCQNYAISRGEHGKKYTDKELAELFKTLENAGAHNINLVSATPYSEHIVNALNIYRPNIPIVWNSSGYESIKTLKLLDGYIDIYLPDLKYVSPALSTKYSGTPDYFKYAYLAISEMIAQRGKPKIIDGIMQSGVIVRHLILPNNIQNSLDVLKVYAQSFKDNSLFSLMLQFTPCNTEKYPEINRTLKPLEYKRVIKAMNELNITEGFFQEPNSADIRYIPDFSIQNGL